MERTKKLSLFLSLAMIKLVFWPTAAYADFFGTVEPPDALRYLNTQSPQGLFTFLNVLIKVLISASGIYALFNFIMAGYGFLSANGNSDNITKAWDKIWQSLLGLLIVTGSFVIGGVIGWLVFHNPYALIEPRLFSPNP